MMQANSGGASPPNAKPHQRANWQGFKNQNQQTNYSKSAADCLYELRNVMLETIGSAPDYLSASGKLTRFDTQKKGDKAGWYICHATRWGLVARICITLAHGRLGRYHLSRAHRALAQTILTGG